jgi:HTH-type transcriptional regulator/antitoxin HigA
VEIRPIKTEQDYDAALAKVEALWGAEPDTPEGDKLDVLITLVGAYEVKHHPIAPPTPSRPSYTAWNRRDWNARTWNPTSGAADASPRCLTTSALITLEMIRKLWKGLHIPLESLIQTSDDGNHQQHA